MPEEPGGSDLHARLEHLENRIKALEDHIAAQQRGDPGPHYYESGTIHPELDDQQIAP
jgi:hypothetical protein